MTKIIVFTLPSCVNCPKAKELCKDVANETKCEYNEIDISTPDGEIEGLMHGVLSTPSIAIDGEVMFRSVVPTREEVIEEVKKRT